ncbi:MAG: lamin tail domain-containing protein [Caldilineales bacterium]|nr:lamin tail domain-containing protein [Caldilineales bacterium]
MASRAAGKVSIAELRHAGDDEVVVIRNTGLAQDMTGWQLHSGQGERRFHFPAGFVLMPDAEVRIHSGPEAEAATPNDLVWTTQRIWRHEGDTATLIDAGGAVVSTFSYGGN